ncbi:hypothetical protein FUAX_12460 [Fulvitalea axinellae]|uniref:VWFA domain-containing protein n=1 Tax=Fulvitalea axinellae TaxID=1182444 RepID=A0AAU9CQW0_9BACT|nr:hypothetical protein FUAX_12460 [Fulvitalea axinellae]
MREIYQKLRQYEIRIRKAIKSHMQGDYHSIFKGSGLEFDDVRVYQYGDDVRTIDWKVSAKGIGTYVKTFKEDKEQNVFFLVDVSASQEIGKRGRTKLDVAKEISGVLMLSAAKENSSAGLIAFSDERELFIKPGKGVKHAYQIIKRLYDLRPGSLKTDLGQAIRFTLNTLKRRSVVILVSDFIDEGYEHNLKGLAREHDLVVIHITDRRETKLPGLGIVPLHDKESGKTIWFNTSSSEFKEKIGSKYGSKQRDLEDLCRRNQTDYLGLDTEEDYVPQLIRLFKVRNKTKKRDK